MGKRVGTYIQELRQEKGTTIRKLAGQVGLSYGHISMIERGEREVSLGTLFPIIQTLEGDFVRAMCLLAIDAGIPEEALPQKSV